MLGLASAATRGNWEVKLDTEQSLEKFFIDEERRAFRIAEIATSNRDDALDIVQDAMLSLAQKYSSKPESQWPALFYRILHSRIVDWYRRRQVRGRWMIWLQRDPEQDILNEILDQHGIGPAKRVQLDDIGEALQEALRKLPLRQQQAFLFRAWEGLDVAQTAKAMACSQGSVKTHYSRAVSALRNLLEGYWP